MKVAVVTPYYRESFEILMRCHNSVKSQTYPDITHFLVADGFPNITCDKLQNFKIKNNKKTIKVQHIKLPNSHNDAGATPRAIGALSAFSQQFDAVAFLDADNWYEPDHISEMVENMKANSSDAVIATRTIHALDETPLYVDTIESNGENMVDTNSWFLGRNTSRLMSFWITAPSQRLVSDKIFFYACRQNNMKISRCLKPTVAYVTHWAWHYKQAGKLIPPDSVWIDTDKNGSLIHIKEKDRRLL